MMICAQTHLEILFDGGKCPLCSVLEQNRTLKRKLDDLEFQLLISDEEVIFEFETGDEKRVCCPGGRT
jgi:hypothetical protein